MKRQTFHFNEVHRLDSVKDMFAVKFKFNIGRNPRFEFNVLDEPSVDVWHSLDQWARDLKRQNHCWRQHRLVAHHHMSRGHSTVTATTATRGWWWQDPVVTKMGRYNKGSLSKAGPSEARRGLMTVPLMTGHHGWTLTTTAHATTSKSPKWRSEIDCKYCMTDWQCSIINSHH